MIYDGKIVKKEKKKKESYVSLSTSSRTVVVI